MFSAAFFRKYAGYTIVALLVLVCHQSSTAQTANYNAIKPLFEKGLALEQTHPDSALQCYENALQKSIVLKDDFGNAYAHYLLGRYYRNNSEYLRALNFFNEGVVIAKRLKTDSGLAAKMYNGIGGYFYFIGSMDSAMVYFFRAIGEAEQKGYKDPSFLSLIYNNIGSVFVQLKNVRQGVDYISRAELIARTNHLEGMEGRACLSFGVLYTDLQKDIPKARQYFERALVIGRSLNDAGLITDAIINLSTICMEEGKLGDALNYLREPLRLLNKVPPRMAIALNFSNGMVLRKMKRYQEAIVYLQMAKVAAQQLHLNEYIQRSNNELAIVYATTKNYEQAYTVLQEYLALKDSTSEKEQEKNASELDRKYRLAEKDKQLSQQQLLLTRQQYNLRTKNMLIAGFSIGLLLLCAALFSFRRSYQRKKQLHDAAYLHLQQDTMINELSARIEGEEKERKRIARELHDGIISQLLAIKLNLSLLRNKKQHSIHPSELSEVLQQLDDAAMEARKTSHNLLPQVILEEGLVAAITMFCSKFDHQVSPVIDLQVHGDLPRLQREIELSVYRIVQELIQNSLKHASASELLVQVSFNNSLMSLTIEDNGIGFDTEHTAKGNGFSNITDRIKALNGFADIYSQPGKGTTIYLEFDVTAFQKTAIACP